MRRGEFIPHHPNLQLGDDEHQCAMPLLIVAFLIHQFFHGLVD